MKHIVLMDSLLVGHPKIDAEHAELVKLVNEFVDIAKGESGDDGCEKIGEIAEKLRRHIENEEAIMVRVGYRITDAEERHHREALARIADLHARARAETDAIELARDLTEIILVTILKTDMGLKGYFPDIEGTF